MSSDKEYPDKESADRSREETAQELGQMLGEIVKALHQQIRKQFQQFTGQLQLTVPQIFLLRTLVTNGPTSISDLAEHLNLANSTVSGIVDRLERDGFVTRARDEADRRIVYVRLTERSEQFKEQVPKFHQKFLNELVHGVDEAKLEQMRESFQTLYGLIQRFADKEEGRE